MNPYWKKEEINIKMSKSDLANILGIGINGLKSIEKRDQLKDRLSAKGYNIISKNKEGRKVMYLVDKKDNSKELLNNIIQYVFGTTKYKEFTKYFLYRMNNLDKPITQEQIAAHVGVNINTINKWDKSLLDHEILFKEGYWYIRRMSDKSEQITDNFEYESYRNNKVVIARENRINNKYINEEISEDVYNMVMDSINDRKGFTDEKYIFKIRRYSRSPYKLADDILKMINGYYEPEALYRDV